MVVGLLFMARMRMFVGPVCIPDVVVVVRVHRVAVCVGMAVLMGVRMGVAVLVRMAVDRIAVSMGVFMVMGMLVAVFVLVFVLAFHGALPYQLVLNWTGLKWRPAIGVFIWIIKTGGKNVNSIGKLPP
jgi:hypothetical protein